MTKLSNTQAILLSTAAQRDSLSILPLPATVKASGAGKAIAALIKQGFAEERETTDPTAAHRTDGDARYGVFATAAGLAAVGVTPDAGVEPAATPPAPSSAPARVAKTDSVLALLRRDEGATLAELIAATGWLPHTTRAALTGLRKKGHAVERSKREDANCYRVAA